MILGRCMLTGLAVNPANGRLYVDTQTGLYRVDSPQSATRIGDR